MEEERPVREECDKKGPRSTPIAWTPEEDELLKAAVLALGPKQWSAIALSVTGRSNEQCRQRWINQIDPNIRHDAWTEAEDAMILHHATQGSGWTQIAKLLPGRPANAINNRWSSTLCPRNRSAGQKRSKIPL